MTNDFSLNRQMPNAIPYVCYLTIRSGKKKGIACCYQVFDPIETVRTCKLCRIKCALPVPVIKSRHPDPVILHVLSHGIAYTTGTNNSYLHVITFL